MHPILFQYGRITVYTYGVFLAAGFLSCLWLMGREARRRGLDPHVFQDLWFVVLVSALAGARAFYVVIEWEQFSQNPLEIFAIWRGGLVFYGGLVCALLASLGYLKVKGLSPWVTGDVVAPGVALGQSVGRLGCLFAGCCYGAECELPWAITFADPRGLAPLGVPLHPTQVYSVLGNALVFFLLYFVARPRQRFDGQISGLYLVLYPAVRFGIEMFRGDPRGALGPLSTSQALGIPLFLVGLGILIFRKPPD